MTLPVHWVFLVPAGYPAYMDFDAAYVEHQRWGYDIRLWVQQQLARTYDIQFTRINSTRDIYELASLDTGQTTLSATIVQGATSITVSSMTQTFIDANTVPVPANIPEGKQFYIIDPTNGNEQVQWTSIDIPTKTFTGCTRGLGATTDTGHAGGRVVKISALDGCASAAVPGGQSISRARVSEELITAGIRVAGQPWAGMVHAIGAGGYAEGEYPLATGNYGINGDWHMRYHITGVLDQCCVLNMNAALCEVDGRAATGHEFLHVLGHDHTPYVTWPGAWTDVVRGNILTTFGSITSQFLRSFGETSRTISSTASLVSTELVQPPLPVGSYIDAEYSNHLIDTDGKAAEVALRLMTRFGRVPRQVRAELVGDPRMDLTQTITLNMPELDYASQKFMVTGIEHDVSAQGYVVRTDLRGGDELGGTVAINPIAQFTHTVEREVIGDKVVAVVTFDATGSFDPDGTIVSWVWSDNRTTTPEISTFTGSLATVQIDPNTIPVGETWDVTLTVTDSDGLTDAALAEIDIAATASAVKLPALFVANNNNASVSPDGGQTWYDRSGSTCTVVAARPPDGTNSGDAVFGYADGSIKRTTDFGQTTLTTVLAAVGSPWTDMRWDWRNGNTVWGITEDCRVYVSAFDAGVTWGLYGGAGLRTTLGLAGALGNRIGLPPGGGVVVYGGDGNGTPLIAYDLGLTNQWTVVGHTSHAATDFPGTPSMRIADFANPLPNQHVICLTNATGGPGTLRALYHSTSTLGPSMSWARGTGISGANTTGRYVVGDAPIAGAGIYRAAFNDRSVWRTTNGVAWTETTNVMPPGTTPNHALFLSDDLTGFTGMQGVYAVAAENTGGTLGLYKSTDGLQTVGALRPATGFPAWPSTAKAKMVAVGGPVKSSAVASRVAAITTSASPRTVTKLGDNASWSGLTSIAGITSSDPGLYPASPTVWFATNETGSSSAVTGNASRSLDAGVTWTADNLASGFGFARAADGTWWAFTREIAGFTQTKIWKSSPLSMGGTWSLITTIGNGTSEVRRGVRIACHPTDSRSIAVWGSASSGSVDGFVCATANSGAGWLTFLSSQGGAFPIPVEGQLGSDYFYGFTILSSSRFIWSGASPDGSPTHWAIKRTDDRFGRQWSTAYTEDSTDVRFIGLGSSPSGKVVVLRSTVATPSTKPLISLDFGVTWNLSTVQSMQSYLGLPTANAKAMAYDAQRDELYVAVTENNAADKRIVKLAPVSNAGVWYNLTDGIATGSFGADNLAVVPSQ